MNDIAVDAVRSAFDQNFLRGSEVGAAVSVWVDGAERVSLWQGHRDAARTLPWESDTMVLIWSATKGIASASVLHALEAAGVPLDARVAGVWKEFGQCGKESITFGQVLSHRAGLGALDSADLSILDHAGVARAIERQVPKWTPGDGHGYGPRTFGFIADEIVRHLCGGISLGRYFREEIGDPLELDLWIGLPSELHDRTAQMLAARSGCGDAEDAFLQRLAEPGSLTRQAFSNPGGLAGASAMNSPAARAASIPSLGGIGTASALAKFYAMLACGGSWHGRKFFSKEMIGRMATIQAQGYDRVLHIETAFSAGFMQDPMDPTGRKLRHGFGPSVRAFGHPGAGGSLGFADPDRRIGFGYVMNQMETGVLPGERALSLVRALYSTGGERRG